MTMRRFGCLAPSALVVLSLCSLTVQAADLPRDPGGPADAEHVGPWRPYAAMHWSAYPQPRRFDIYGNALGGLFVAGPDPLVVNNGCPKALEPIYDVDGNLAGYAPFVACR